MMRTYELALSIFDKVCFEILAILFDERKGLRFKDFKGKIAVSDPVLSRRLSLLKQHGLVQVSPIVDDETESKYFVYKITNEGIAFANRVAISDLMRAVDEIDRRKRSR
jgi:DNA-binding HxlR family transcriptional regulator